MSKAQIPHRPLSPMQHNFSNFMRPAHPLYPPLASQNQYMVRTPDHSLAYQNQYMMMRTL